MKFRAILITAIAALLAASVIASHAVQLGATHYFGK